MNNSKDKLKARIRRHNRVRAKISGTATRPRLSVFRSNKDIYVQLIDDDAGKTMISANSKEIKKPEAKDMTRKVSLSFLLGKVIAEKAVKEKISEAVYDRGGYKYHGRVKAVAEGAREGGLKI